MYFLYSYFPPMDEPGSGIVLKEIGLSRTTLLTEYVVFLTDESDVCEY
jgi:hypothetical protein